MCQNWYRFWDLWQRPIQNSLDRGLLCATGLIGSLAVDAGALWPLLFLLFPVWLKKLDAQTTKLQAFQMGWCSGFGFHIGFFLWGFELTYPTDDLLFCFISFIVFLALLPLFFGASALAIFFTSRPGWSRWIAFAGWFSFLTYSGWIIIPNGCDLQSSLFALGSTLVVQQILHPWVLLVLVFLIFSAGYILPFFKIKRMASDAY